MTQAFTDDQISEDGSNRVQRAAGQVGLATAAITLVEWGVTGFELNDGHFPVTVFGSMVTIAAWAFAYLANRRKIRANR